MFPRKKQSDNNYAYSEIESVKVSERCYESRPCQHDVTVKFKQGKTEKFRMSSPEIERDYGNYIPYANSHGSIWKKYPDHFAENIKNYEEKQKLKIK